MAGFQKNKKAPYARAERIRRGEDAFVRNTRSQDTRR